MNRETVNERTCIAHVVFSLHFGGIESVVRTIALASLREGLPTVIVVLSRGGFVSDELKSKGVMVQDLNSSGNVRSLPTLVRLILLLRRLRPRVVHTRGAEANFHGILAGTFAGVPVRVAEEVGLPDHSPIARLIFRFVYSLSTRVLAVSETTAERVVTLREASRHKITVVDSPVFLETGRAQQVRKDPFFSVSFVGRLEEIKNPLSLIRALAILSNPARPVNLKIIGEGSQRALLEQEAQNLGVSELVTFLGFKSDPVGSLITSHLVVQPSISEGMSISLIEAMAAGVPVLASSIGGATELLEHGHNGWLLTGADPGSIAQALSSIRGLGPQGIQQVGLQAQSTVANRFEARRYLEKMQRVYLTANKRLQNHG
jgi:glycosyltransferase involved in cell wall biosynthesis